MSRKNPVSFVVVACVLALILLVVIAGCITATGTVSGTIVNSLTGKPVSGVKLTTDPPTKDLNVESNESGAYSANLPVGSLAVSFKKDGYQAVTQTIGVISGQTMTRNIVLKPAKPVAVNAGKVQKSSPGGSVTLKATAEPLDGSTITGYQWSQVSGAKAVIDNPANATVKVTLGDAAAYKDALTKGLMQEDRFGVQSISPHGLAAGEAATFKVTATTSSGSYSSTVDVTVDLPFVANGGLQNVPKGLTVLVHGKNQSGYDWALSGPSGTKAALDKTSDQNPSFVPDVVGKYTLTEKKSGATVEVYAGTWVGVIAGLDAKGLQISADCTSCHNGTIAPDKFTDWKASGHSQIFTKNINTSDHYAEACLDCHAVGFNKAVNNGGMDDAADYAAFEKSGMFDHANPANWKDAVAKYPKAAKLANIQCENCHGPNDGGGVHANKALKATRVSISSDVCGACHGEPPRHGRFQQWEESGHANFELAIEDATVEARGATAAHCGRCHAGQGFLTWIKQKDLTQQIQGAKGNATVDELKAMGLTKDTVQPQTCVVCHDPHKEGASSGKPNTATVRITDDTKKLPAGFQAKAVGKGAMCMTCHNTRNGLHNTANPPANYSAPHVASQTDVLMGENVYLVEGQRSAHANIRDTCVTCHMVKSLPPAEFSFQRGGTNHSFKADIAVCSSCHSADLNGKALQVGIEEKLEELAAKMGTYLGKKLPVQFTLIDYTPHKNGGKSYDIKSDAVQVAKDNIVSLSPFEPHGQQGFLIKFKNPVSVTYKLANESAHTISVSEVQVQLGDITSDGTPIIPVTDTLIKAGWNYFIVHGDSSKGVHNPAFINEVLNASLEALK